VTVVVVVVGYMYVGTVGRGKVVGGEAYKFKGSRIALRSDSLYIYTGVGVIYIEGGSVNRCFKISVGTSRKLYL
jgi:hypothetical protein